MTNKAYIGLSSNLGDLGANLDKAIHYLKAEEGIELLAVSKRYKTNPVGVLVEMPFFLNQVVKVSYTGTARQLLFDVLFKIENFLGRKRAEDKTLGPQARTMDLDLLLFGEEKWELMELTIPHPRMFERAFVLAPLLDVWDDECALPELKINRTFLAQCLESLNCTIDNQCIQQK